MTLEELDRASRARAAGNRRLFVVLAVFCFAVFLVLAGLLQIQQQHLKAFVQQQCLQRQANTLRSNEIWADLARVEEDRPLPEKFQGERLSVYRNAHLDVPVCD